MKSSLFYRVDILKSHFKDKRELNFFFFFKKNTVYLRILEIEMIFENTQHIVPYFLRLVLGTFILIYNIVREARSLHTKAQSSGGIICQQIR